ncbi:MAG: N-acyl homoserine lactonase family protein [Deltaproteobacteria bacterium]|nr:N-acyl homoserine lactonase family protein [Deltaproteobacteria bacterium]
MVTGAKSIASLLAFVLAFFVSPTFAQDAGIVPLTNPPPHTLHLYCLSTGSIETRQNQLVAGGSWQKVSVPVPVYLIRHPAAWILFDTGYGSQTKSDFSGLLGKLVSFFMGIRWQPEDSVLAQLKKIHLPPEEIRFILLSHLHSDHAGGLRDFPRATVFLSQAEWEAAQGGRWSHFRNGQISRQWETDLRRIAPISDRRGFPYQGFDHAHDLFGDGSLILLSTPGHTPGHWSLLLNFPSGKSILLTGDAAWTKENYQKPARRGFLARHLTRHDETKEWESLVKIRKFAEDNPDLMVIPGHDPAVWSTLKKFPEYYK